MNSLYRLIQTYKQSCPFLTYSVQSCPVGQSLSCPVQSLFSSSVLSWHVKDMTGLHNIFLSFSWRSGFDSSIERVQWNAIRSKQFCDDVLLGVKSSFVGPSLFIEFIIICYLSFVHIWALKSTEQIKWIAMMLYLIVLKCHPGMKTMLFTKYVRIFIMTNLQ